MNRQNFAVVGDIWVGGQRDRTGLTLPLHGAISALMPEDTYPTIADLTGSGGLSSALRRVAAWNWPGECRSIICVGMEDSSQNPKPEAWAASFLSLVRQVRDHGPLLIIQPGPIQSRLSNPGGYNRGARRWAARCLNAACAEAAKIEDVQVMAPGLDERHFADSIWLKDSGIRELAIQAARKLAQI